MNNDPELDKSLLNAEEGEATSVSKDSLDDDSGGSSRASHGGFSLVLLFFLIGLVLLGPFGAILATLIVLAYLLLGPGKVLYCLAAVSFGIAAFVLVGPEFFDLRGRIFFE